MGLVSGGERQKRRIILSRVIRRFRGGKRVETIWLYSITVRINVFVHM